MSKVFIAEDNDFWGEMVRKKREIVVIGTELFKGHIGLVYKVSKYLKDCGVKLILCSPCRVNDGFVLDHESAFAWQIECLFKYEGPEHMVIRMGDDFQKIMGKWTKANPIIQPANYIYPINPLHFSTIIQNVEWETGVFHYRSISGISELDAFNLLHENLGTKGQYREKDGRYLPLIYDSRHEIKFLCPKLTVELAIAQVCAEKWS